MPFFLQGIVLGFTAAATPGPFQAYLIAQSLRSGWKRAWPSMFAPLISDGPIALLALLTLSVVPDWLVRGLRLAGGLFLLYLAWIAWRGLRRAAPDIIDENAQTSPASPTARQGLRNAAIANALSPGPWIFWSTVGGPLFLSGWVQARSLGVAFLIGFYAAMLAVLAAIIALFANAARLGPRVTRKLQALSALALLGFGLFQLWAGILS